MPEMRAATAAGSAPGVSCTKVLKPEAFQPDANIGFVAVESERSAENWSSELAGNWPTMPVTS